MKKSMKKFFSYFPIIVHEFSKAALLLAKPFSFVSAKKRSGGEGNKKQEAGLSFNDAKRHYNLI